LHLRLIAPLAAALALSACANTKPPVLADNDPRNDGIATTCTPTNPDMKAAGPYSGAIAMANDGWCGVFAVERDGKPFSLGLVRNRPEHGRVFIQKVANATRVEYTPNAGYVGADAFTVALRSNKSGVEDTPLQVSVTVSQGTRASSEPEAEPASTRRSTTPAKRRTTKRSSSN
jgi:hypothetical protein